MSIEPNPTVEIFPENEIFAKSARLASTEANIDHPPLPSISERRNSLNQTSPLKICPISSLGFLTPTMIFLMDPIVGLPLIAYLYFFSPGNVEILVNSSITSKFSLK